MRNDDAVAPEQAFSDWAAKKLKNDVLSVQAQVNPGATSKARNDFERHRELRLEKLARVPAELLVGHVAGEVGEFRIGLQTVYDASGEVAVMDWRAPAARPFFESRGVAMRHFDFRRTISMRGSKVEVCEDDFGAPPKAPLEPLPLPPSFPVRASADRRNGIGHSARAMRTPVEPRDPAFGSGPLHGAAVRAQRNGDGAAKSSADDAKALEVRAAAILANQLAAARTGRLRQHLSTLQPDQFALVASDPGEHLIVEGGPGTGKTIVALHRAAYLLGPEGKTAAGATSDQVLIVGPSSDYVDYLSAFMASLGIGGGVSPGITVLSLEGVARLLLDLMDVDVGALALVHDDATASAIKASAVFASILERFVWSHARIDDVVIRLQDVVLHVDAKDVREFVVVLRRSKTPYGKAQAEYSKFLHSRLDHLLDGAAILSGTDRRRVHGELDQIVATDELLDDAFPVIEKLRREYVSLLGDPQKMAAFADGELDQGAVAAVAGEMARNRATGRLTRQDLYLLVHVARQIHGTEYWPRMKAIVVDEGQDVSQLEWQTLAALGAGGVFTILGDLGQSTSGTGLGDWGSVQSVLGMESANHGVLRRSYRTPRMLENVVGGLRPKNAEHPMESESVAISGESVELMKAISRRDFVPIIRDLRARYGGLMAVIGTPHHIADLISDMRHSGCRFIRSMAASEEDLAQLPLLFTTDRIKGLEFDTVVIVEPSELVKSTASGPRELYVAASRATVRLILLTADGLSGALIRLFGLTERA